ncbi:integral membrane TerC family protein [Zostera marina]|uniref:Integral membrane TerC family protein n=1 Tax=Zostera marina TaxID=29655 RepID=A0A0K9PA70_ZOSMR|nr:integral membrane TerC family protein [Zostera marina]
MGFANVVVSNHGSHLPVNFRSSFIDARSSLSATSRFSFPATVGSGLGACTLKMWPRIGRALKTKHQDGIAVSEDKESVELGNENDTLDEKTMGTQTDTSNLLKIVLFWISAAVVFGIGLGIKDGAGKASEFFAGYLLEKSLSVDNLFVFVLIFKYFKVPKECQGRVLSYGIAGAVVFRGIMIGLGSATLQRFEAVNLFLALILLYSAYKLFVIKEEADDLSKNYIVKTCQKIIPVTSFYDGDRFFTIQDGIRKATPLLLTAAVLELSDIAFAIDSIPAVFGVTRDPFIVFSSNIFAILGLRSLFRLISEKMSELEYLPPAIGVVLAFIGTKMIADFFGYHVSTELSLCFVAASLGTGFTLSIFKKSD